MRYYTWVEPDEKDASIPVYQTLSEDDIHREYYPYWYERMCEKFGKEVVDSIYSFEDCLNDFAVIHWASVSEQ